MAANPIEIDEQMASSLEEVTTKFKDSEAPVDRKIDANVVDIIRTLSSKIKSNTTEDEADKFAKEIELLNEMGFSDDEINFRGLEFFIWKCLLNSLFISELSSEFGNIDRVVNKLLSV